MYLDKLNIYSENQAVVTGTSTNVIDKGAGGDAYSGLFLAVSMSVPLAPAEELKVVVETSADNVTFAEVASFTAKKGQGFALGQRIPFGMKQYSRLKYNVTGTPSGKLTAYLTTGIPTR